MTTEIRIPLHGRYTRPDGAIITVTPTGIEFYKVTTDGGPAISMIAQAVRDMIAQQRLTKEESN